MKTTVRDYRALVVCYSTASVKYSGDAAKENKNQKKNSTLIIFLERGLSYKNFFSL
jgi:hypothetical protein